MQALAESHFIPDVLPKKEYPLAFETTAKYDTGASFVGVKAGQNILTPTQVQNLPHLTMSPLKEGAKPKKYLTVCLTDPDAPNRKDHTYREWLHFICGNIEVKPEADGKISIDFSKGEEIVSYVSSAPPNGSGLHRYCWLVLDHDEKINFGGFKIGMTGDGRAKFRIGQFLEKHGLHCDKSLISVAIYEAQYDDYVPKVYAKLK